MRQARVAFDVTIYTALEVAFPSTLSLGAGSGQELTYGALKTINFSMWLCILQ